jgi:predicted DCC family thiol-disulfide oxidoreductase YuxK
MNKIDTAQNHSIVLFDGECSFCSRSVQFIIRHDPAERFAFVPMQSDRGKTLAAGYALNTAGGETLILVQDGRCYLRSDAVLEIAAGLSGRWRLLRHLNVVPRPVRDLGYRFIARNRYRWFGRRTSCFRPDEAVRRRFPE